MHGRLPTPAPALVVPVARGRGQRLALGLEGHCFGAALAGGVDAAGLAVLRAQGWRVVVLAAERVLRGDPAFLTGHLEREFHLHLLDQVG